MRTLLKKTLNSVLVMKTPRFLRMNRCWLPTLLGLVCLLMSPQAWAGGIETKSKCNGQNCEPDHGEYVGTWPDYWNPPADDWISRWDSPMPQVGDKYWSSWGYGPSVMGEYLLFLPVLTEVMEVSVNPANQDEYRARLRYHVFSLPEYLYGLSETEIYALMEKASCSQTERNRAASSDSLKAGNTLVTPPGLGSGSPGGCSSCGGTEQEAGRFKVSISLGSGIGGVPELSGSPAGQINFNGNLAQGDMLTLANFAAIGGSGWLDGSFASGSVTVRELTSNTATATATIQTTTGTDGRLSVVEITVTPQPAGAAAASTHRFERVTAQGGLEGVRYTRTEGTDSESMVFYNTGTDAPWANTLSGSFKMVNTDGSMETWDAPPEIPAGEAQPTFVWTAAGGHVNGGYFVGELTERHEYQPADASQPTVVTLRTYGKIGGEYYNQRVLLREEVSQVRGTTTLSTEVTRHGYDENPFRSISTANPYGTPNERFGKRVWTLAADGAWSLEMAQEIPTLVDYWVWNEATEDYDVVQELEFVYGDVMEFTPWLNGPAGAGDLGTQAAASAFFEGLMAEARGNGFTIAGCRRTATTSAGSLSTYAAWKEKRITSLGPVAHGVEYQYDGASSSTLNLGGSLGNFGLNQRQERWNATESAGTWSASSSGNANVSVTLDHAGVARISSTSSLTGGGSVNDSWQVAVTAQGGYGEYRSPPSYTAVADHPLWSTTSYDDQGRVVAEATRFGTGENGTTIQTITTSYSGTNGSTRSAGGVTLGSQGEDVIANGQRTATSTDAQGVTTTTVTDEATGELISETRLGVTTNYAKTTAGNGHTTQTVTQTAGAATRTLSVTVTDAQGRTVSSTDANGGETTYDYANNGRTVIETLPGGLTRITQTYLDGQLQSVTGTAGVAEYHSYTVNSGSAAYEAGSITETVHYGTSNGAHWRKVTTNFLGQVLREEEPSPAGAGAVIVTTHEYNAKGQRMKTSRTGTADMIVEYDDWGRVAKQGYDVSGDNALTVNSNDVLSTSSTDYVQAQGTVLERTVRTQYRQDGSATGALQTTTERKLLEGSQWQRVTQADGSVLTQWDEVNGGTRIEHAQQVNGAVTVTQTRTYQNGALVSETQPGMTQAITYQSNALGEITQVVHPLSGTTTRTYDAQGRVLTQTQSGGGTETYAYNAQGQVASITHADNTTTTYTYDAQGRQTSQGGTAGYALSYEYDALGRLRKLHTTRGSSDDVTTWEYVPGTNALASKTDAAGRSVTYTYNAAGRQQTRAWQRGVVTTYSYDGVGRLTSIDYSDSTPDVSHAYDRAGRKVSTTDAAGTHTFAYDAASGGQLASWSVGGSGVWSGLNVAHTYSDGQRSSRATSLGGISLPTSSYAYDATSGRMESVSADGVTATYRYNAATGWNEGVTYSSGLSSTRTPDTLGRLDAVTWNAGGITVSKHDYSINAMNRRTSALRQDGSQWNYDYNDRGEVTSAAKEDAIGIPEPGKQFTFTFDGIGNRTGSSGSTVSSLADNEVLRSTGYAPNELNQYEQITHPSPGWLVLRGSANTAATVTIDNELPTLRFGALWHYEQSVDNSSGSVRRVAEITATRSTGGLNNGPVTTKRKGATFIPPPVETPTYDWDGNQTSDARWNYTWDGENRMILAEEKAAAVQPAESTVKRLKLEFTYDAQGRRIRKVVQSFSSADQTWSVTSDLIFIYDGWNLVAELNMKPETSNLELLRSYEWGLDVSGTLDGAGGVGGQLIQRHHQASSIQQPAPSFAPCFDGNGNITELINLSNGSASARYEYGAFGETISVDGGAVAEANPFRFSTKYLDGETGMIDYLNRIYKPSDGRWLNRDPIEEQGGINLYGMVSNDPVNRWDYLGFQAGYDPRSSIPPASPSGPSPENSQVNDPFPWHHTRHENVVTGCCCSVKEMQEMARSHLRTFDLFNFANTGSRVEVSNGHALFTPTGFWNTIQLAGSLSKVGVTIATGPPNALYDLQAVTEEWHPLIGRRRWGSKPLMTKVGECSSIVIWTEAYEVANNLVSLGEFAAHAAANTMWNAYLNEVGKTLSVHCGGHSKGSSRVLEETLSTGPMPWR
jgi:RHS repeat-associated protein